VVWSGWSGGAWCGVVRPCGVVWCGVILPSSSPTLSVCVRERVCVHGIAEVSTEGRNVCVYLCMCMYVCVCERARPTVSRSVCVCVCTREREIERVREIESMGGQE